MPNQSKVRDPRFWRKWKESGGVKLTRFNQQQHPELRPGEVWITNSDNSDYHQIGWRTKRKGITALDNLGRPIGHISWPGCFPVFAKKSELGAAGVTISHKPEPVRYFKPLR